MDSNVQIKCTDGTSRTLEVLVDGVSVKGLVSVCIPRVTVNHLVVVQIQIEGVELDVNYVSVDDLKDIVEGEE